MAGFLGTLFMGNVGLRLLLPPKSAYNKMAQEFGAGAKKIGLIGKNEQGKSARAQEQKTKESLLKARLIFQKASKDQSSDAIKALQSELQTLDRITGGAISKVDKQLELSALNRSKRGGVFGGKDLSDLGTLLGGAEVDAGITSPEEMLEQFNAKLTSVARGAMEVFHNSVTTSVTALTVLGFQIQTVARSLISYENELVNANSIFQVSNDELYSISNEVVDVGLQYALTYDNMSQALYQFASAGLDASESLQILADVMKLSMAVQGDSETLGKLLIQTIKGFGMEFEESGKLVDQFALAINESLLEYQDLASAVKFAMPFFVSTNQGVEQLLGGLAVLTDRALEAGIAGRGLRQALAELAESLGDNTRKFQEMGINITDANGNLLQMTDIAAEFARHFGEAANDTELLTTLISDLNVRGATAFVHLVQNSEEFAEVTEKIANAQGDATRMADKQMESLSNQILVTKNAMMAAFLYGEAQEDGTMGVNSFHKALLDMVKMFRSKFVVELEDGTMMITEFGFQMRDVATRFVEQFTVILEKLLDFINSLNASGFDFIRMLNILFLPLRLVVGLMEMLPEFARSSVLEFFLLSRMVGMTGAAFFMAGDMLFRFNQFVAQGNEQVARLLGLLETVAGVALTVFSILPAVRVGRAAVGAMSVGNTALRSRVGLASTFSVEAAKQGIGKGTMGLAAASALTGFSGVKAGIGLTGIGVAQMMGAGGADGGQSSYDAYAQSLQGNAFNGGMGGMSPTTLNVENANFRTDNLNDTFYSSGYGT